MELFNNISPSIADALTGIEKQFILMRSSGSSVREIAKKLNKSTHTICNWNKKFAKEIVSIRNNEFSELQKKVIDSKTQRLNLLNSEFERASNLLKKHKMDVNDTFGSYNKFLELFVKLSDLMSSCESDILTVGVKFKDNIEPEISMSEIEKDIDLSYVSPNSNIVADERTNKTTDKTKLKTGEQQNATNCNTTTPKKFEMYNKHKLKKSI